MAQIVQCKDCETEKDLPFTMAGVVGSWSDSNCTISLDQKWHKKVVKAVSEIVYVFLNTLCLEIDCLYRLSIFSLLPIVMRDARYICQKLMSFGRVKRINTVNVLRKIIYERFTNNGALSG